jgi:signal peptidase I
MRKSRRLPDAVANILLVVGLAAIWIALAPVKLGGQVSYVMVNGISMEPGFHGGDLVVVRQASEYQVGDIVTYRDGEMGAYVIHRIIGTEQNRFVLKGDNNSWIDEYQPTRDEIVGKLWIHLPKLGKTVEWVRKPINMALLVGFLGGLFMVNITTQKQNKNSKKKNSATGNSAGTFGMALYMFGILGLVFLVLSIFAFSRPVMRTADSIPYEQIGTFFYSATGTPGMYDTDSVRSGEPVFTKLTCTLNLGFVYVLDGNQLENISGYQQFYAMVLDEQSGWQRTIPLISDTNFTGNTYTSMATLDLCQVQSLIAWAEQETGYHPSTYTLVIIASVSVGGKISGQEFADTFESRLTFRFNPSLFYLAENSSQADPLQTVQLGSLGNPGLVENTLKLFGLNPTIRGMRVVSIIGLVISLGGLLVLGLYFYTVSKHNQDAIIRIKYGALLMDVYDRGLETLSPVIDVATIEDLAKLAERQNTMIMHQTRDLVHYYLVQIEGTTYRYVTGKGRTNNSGLHQEELP